MDLKIFYFSYSYLLCPRELNNGSKKSFGTLRQHHLDRKIQFLFYQKIILMTAIFACICGKYDESQDFENDFKDKHGPLNKHVHFVVKMCFRFYVDYLNFYVLFFNQRIISPAISYQLMEIRHFIPIWTLTICMN